MDKRNIDNLSPEERFFDTSNIEIDGMTCDECVRTIELALRGVDGVREVHVDRAKRLATVIYDTRKTHMPALHDILLSRGYHPTRFAEPVR
ncbi:MAG: Heavy metal transport/detoxification protein [Pedosphaera sp.]|nr:Heavy metal transport/detoxification protein [Pedosphaera sp.]